MSGEKLRLPRTSVHTHTTFCDGENTPAEMAAAAKRAGLETLGFSVHAYVPQEDFGLPPARMGEYCAEIHRLQSEYEGELEILCGIELDTQTPPEQLEQAKKLDYRIGSCHAVQDAAGRFWTVDDTPELFDACIREGFDGDPMAMARAYYEQFVPWVGRLGPEIVGHLDLISKFNRGGRFFDEESPRYRSLCLDAVEGILRSDLVLEVNTGAIGRGWQDRPYPSAFLLRRIREVGGRVTVTADAHSAAGLTCWFDEALALLREIGFGSIWELTAQGWVEEAI